MSRAIRYTPAACSLGHVLLAGGERGIGQLRLGDDPDELVRGFLATCPEATPARHGDELRRWCQALVRHYLDSRAGGSTPPPLPLELRGTPFQLRVWKRLQGIPVGEVRSYGQAARDLGMPRGARAVARACASNPVAVLVPCHRVVPKSGGTGGYRWGSERKRALLRREATRETS